MSLGMWYRLVSWRNKNISDKPSSFIFRIKWKQNSSETSVIIYEIAQCHNQHDSNLHISVCLCLCFDDKPKFHFRKSIRLQKVKIFHNIYAERERERCVYELSRFQQGDELTASLREFTQRLCN
jgi:hypothetical protein